MIYHRCDICGKEDSTVINMSFHPTKTELRSLFDSKSWSGDLCEECLYSMLELVKKKGVKQHE